jgi:hypothetical protein
MSLRRAGGQRAREGRPVAQQREEAQRLTRREAGLLSPVRSIGLRPYERYLSCIERYSTH